MCARTPSQTTPWLDVAVAFGSMPPAGVADDRIADSTIQLVAAERPATPRAFFEGLAAVLAGNFRIVPVP